MGENSYAQLIDDFEKGLLVLEGESLTDYITRMGGVDYEAKAKGGIASLAPRSRYNAGSRVWPPEGARPDGSFDPPQIPETLLQTMPMLNPELLKLMREYKKRQGLARILEV